MLDSPATRAAPAKPSAGWVLFFFLGPALALAAPDPDVSTPERFVEALREAGHGELALEYLDRATDDPFVPESFRSRLGEQRLRTLYTQALAAPDPSARRTALEALLPEARGLASEEGGAAERLVTDLIDQTANALADGALQAVAAARRRPSEAALTAVRADLTAARNRLTEAESRITAEQDRLKGVRAESPEGRRRKQLRVRLGLVQFQRGRLLHELAETNPRDSDERKRLNRQAAAELGEVYERYSQLGPGLLAHFYEGRCYRLLGERQLALAALEDLTRLPDSVAAFRGVATLAHAELAALWVDGGKPERSLAKPAAWYEKLAPGERQGPEAGELAYRLGRAAMVLASGQEDKQAERSWRRALAWLDASVKVPHQRRSAARTLRKEVNASLGDERPASGDFDGAYLAGSEAIEAMLSLEAEIEQADSEADRTELTDQRDQARASAYKALTTATRSVSDDTDPEQAARARYQLAWLDWKGGDAEQTAKRAAYIARRDAGTESAVDAAKLALLALDRLSRQGAAEASERLDQFARFVLNRWPGGDVAQIASTTLVATALRTGDFDTAREIIADAPGEQRPQLALRVAVAEWEQTKEASAFEGMAKAFATATARGGEADALTVTAALYLAREAIARGEAAEARRLLAHPSYGPVAGLDAGRFPTGSPAVAATTLGVLARAEALAGNQANKTLDRLTALLSGPAAEAAGGARVWLGVAAGLYADAQQGPDALRPAVAAALADALGRLSRAGVPDDWNTRLWVAQARLRCHEWLTNASAKQASLEAAAVAFGTLVDRGDTDPAFAPSKNALLAARLRFAQCHRQLGRHEAAMQTLVDMLAAGAVLLEVQTEAAATLQEWGSATDDPELLRQAIVGTRPGPDKKNLVWGWSKLASVTGRYAASNPKRRDQFFEAWRRVAECRYATAQLAGESQRDKQLGKAAGVILALQRQNPDLGGGASRERFDALLRRIQQASGDPVTGLKELAK